MSNLIKLGVGCRALDVRILMVETATDAVFMTYSWRPVNRYSTIHYFKVLSTNTPRKKSKIELVDVPVSSVTGRPMDDCCANSYLCPLTSWPIRVWMSSPPLMTFSHTTSCSADFTANTGSVLYMLNGKWILVRSLSHAVINWAPWYPRVLNGAPYRKQTRSTRFGGFLWSRC